jgi:hypothetical protein
MGSDSEHLALKSTYSSGTFPHSSVRDILKDFCLILESHFGRPNDPQSYAGGSVSSW